MLSLPRARVRSLVGELKSHKLCDVAKTKTKHTHTNKQSPNYSKNSSVYFPKSRTLTYISIMQTSNPGNQHCSDTVIQSTDPIQILAVVPMKFCLSGLRSHPGTLMAFSCHIPLLSSKLKQFYGLSLLCP